MVTSLVMLRNSISMLLLGGFMNSSRYTISYETYVFYVDTSTLVKVVRHIAAMNVHLMFIVGVCRLRNSKTTVLVNTLQYRLIHPRDSN